MLLHFRVSGFAPPGLPPAVGIKIDPLVCCGGNVADQVLDSRKKRRPLPLAPVDVPLTLRGSTYGTSSPPSFDDHTGRQRTRPNDVPMDALISAAFAGAVDDSKEESKVASVAHIEMTEENGSHSPDRARSSDERYPPRSPWRGRRSFSKSMDSFSRGVRGRGSRGSQGSLDSPASRTVVSVFVNLGGVGGDKAVQKHLSGSVLRLSEQCELNGGDDGRAGDDGDGGDGGGGVGGGDSWPILLATKEIEADGLKCIWNQTFRIELPHDALATAALRVDLAVRAQGGALVRAASARVPLPEVRAVRFLASRPNREVSLATQRSPVVARTTAAGFRAARRSRHPLRRATSPLSRRDAAHDRRRSRAVLV